MRTTITIDDVVLEQLKARAVKEGTTVDRLIEEAIASAARQPPDQRPAQPFELVTFGKSGHFTNLNVHDTSALLEEDDIARFRRG